MTDSKGPETGRKDLEMDDQLKTLFEYTKWHIGLYAGLITALIAVLQLYGEELSTPTRLFFVTSLFFFVLAGGAGGIVGSGIPFYRKFDVFMTSKLRPFQNWSNIGRATEPGKNTTQRFTGKWWTHVEHLTFWAGIAVAVSGIIWNEAARWLSEAAAAAHGALPYVSP